MYSFVEQEVLKGPLFYSDDCGDRNKPYDVHFFTQNFSYLY